MEQSAQSIKELREMTGISFAQCKEALIRAGGDKAKALQELKAQGAQIAEKKSSRELRAGTVAAYIHSNKALGTILELSCETDFVAKNPEFQALAQELAMHITAMGGGNTEEVLAQPYIKDPSTTISELINTHIQKFGENITLGRFTRVSTLERS